MVLAMDIEILYANTGVAVKPQAKIIGAKMIFRAPQQIQYRVIFNDSNYSLQEDDILLQSICCTSVLGCELQNRRVELVDQIRR